MTDVRVQPPAAREGAATCVGCAQEVTGARCDYCGATQRAGGYVIERLVAQTAHSRLYLARQPDGPRIALKELHFAAVPGAEQIEAFEREAKTLGALDHPAIPKHFKSFQEGTGIGLRLYLATEFIDGESLATRLARGPLMGEGLRSLAREALAVLVYLQGRSPVVLHRDLKPDNFVFRADGRLALVDFGSVRQIEASRTHRSTLVGTFGYMPPEQLGGTASLSTDLYALGATLLHAASGKPPSALLRPDLSLEIPPRVPGWLRDWLRFALAADPRRRFRDAGEALRELEQPTRRLDSPRRVRPWVAIFGVGVVCAVGAMGVAKAADWSYEIPWMDSDVDAPARVAPPSAATGAQWFAQVRTACNPLEVNRALKNAPPPPGIEGTGYAAGCLALAGKTAEAERLVEQVPANEQWRAVQVVFDLADPVADSGDDVAAAPMMQLVLKYWPNHHQALYHLGLSELALGRPTEGRAHLEEFLKLYKNNDGFRSNAIAALAKLGASPRSP